LTPDGAGNKSNPSLPFAAAPGHGKFPMPSPRREGNRQGVEEKNSRGAEDKKKNKNPTLDVNTGSPVVTGYT